MDLQDKPRREKLYQQTSIIDIWTRTLDITHLFIPYILIQQ